MFEFFDKMLEVVNGGLIINGAYPVKYLILKLFQETNKLHLEFFLCNRHGAFQCGTRYLTCDTHGVMNNVSKFDM